MSYLTTMMARGKTCPHIKIENVNQMTNHDGPIPYVIGHPTQCLADNCMAWRWAGNLPSTEKGYCGLSGAPGPNFPELGPVEVK